ncbi:MAG: ABC transporter permease, partial [Acidisphaera sp.]|nr:ABC transporter permease [Acidisphaera sp.]
MPIDPVIAIVGDHAPPDVMQAVRDQLGLDKPLTTQFWIYLGHLARGDMGRSVMTSHAVTEDIVQYFPATIELATTAIVLATLIGVPLGVLAAVKQRTKIDHAIRVFCLAGHSIPIFLLALLSLLIFYAQLGWAPGTGRQDVAFEGMDPTVTGFLLFDTLWAGDWDAFRDALGHLAQPAGVLAYFSMAYIARMTRGFMLDAL